MTRRDLDKWHPTEAERAELVSRAERIVDCGYIDARMFCSKRDAGVAYWITDAIHYLPEVLAFARKDASSVDWTWLKRDIENYEHHRDTHFREIRDMMADRDRGVLGHFFRWAFGTMFRPKALGSVEAT